MTEPVELLVHTSLPTNPANEEAISGSVNKKRSISVDNNDTYDNMTKDELIAALQERDVRISTLEQERKRVKTTTSTTTPPSSAASSSSTTTTTTATAISPEKLQAKVDQLRKLAYQGIKSQIKWRPACKKGTARFSYTGMCDEVTFRAFLQLQDKDRTKGGKVEGGKFQNDILGNLLMVRIRYGYLTLNGDVNVTYNKETCEIKITGAYGV